MEKQQIKKLSLSFQTGEGLSCAGDDKFKRLARHHQALFRVNQLGINRCLGYGVLLCEEDYFDQNGMPQMFYKGLNQVCQIEALKRYPDKKNMDVYGNMLRSEHIPINLFAPVMQKQSLALLKEWFNKYLNGDIDTIERFLIEHAPSNEILTTGEVIKHEERNRNYLNDHTSFDAYLEYRDKNKDLCAVGIEIKYTEKSYPLAAYTKGMVIDRKKLSNLHQSIRMHHLMEDEISINVNNEGIVSTEQMDGGKLYFDVTCQSGLYNDECIKNFTDQTIETPQKRILTSNRFRQYWRNHVLGESMVLHDDIKRFTSLLLYPKGNKHFEKVSSEYVALLNNPKTFVAVQYEDYFSEMAEIIRRNVASSQQTEYLDWITYLRKRYIVEDTPITR